MTYINNSNSLIPTMNEDANSTQNTMSAQYISLQNICKCVAENTMQLNFHSKSCFENDGKLVFSCEILQKNHPSNQCHKSQCKSANFSPCAPHMPFSIFCCS